jgi:aminotransferase
MMRRDGERAPPMAPPPGIRPGRASALGLSRRADQVTQAEIRTMSIECEKVGGLNLAQGVCNTEVPPMIREAARAAIEAGMNSYTRYDGVAELRRAIAGKLRDLHQIDVDPETQITVSAGSTGAFYSACLALLDPGDGVILFEPFYGYHRNTLASVEASVACVPLRPPDWTFDPRDLERAATARTKAIMVCTPANPSGKVFTLEELTAIIDFAERRDLIIFTDEIYEHFLYDGRRHLSPAALPGAEGRTVAISGFSKTFSITGWRIGYSVSPPRWAQMIGYMSDLVYVCAPAPLQHAVAAGIEMLGPEFYRRLAADYARKRDRICGALSKGGLEPYIPQGAYYVLADASRLPGPTSKARAMELLRRTGVASVPGEAFYEGRGGEEILRFCFAKPDGDLEEACRRIEGLC